MSRCVSPLEGWLAAQANDSGRFPVTFSLHSGRVDHPIDLPCGKCVGCLQDKAEAWSLRCCHEAALHEQNCFVTLTYRDPCPDRLSRPDLQRFFKRLRRTGAKVRYFAVGEYGSRTGRPHYHALIFGQDFLAGAVSFGELYTSPWLTSIWRHGHVVIAPLEPAAAFYVAGYSLKNAGDRDCFQVASRVPPLGKGWLDQYHDDISRNNFVTLDGVKHSVPKAYLARPERALDFDHLKDARREYARTSCSSSREFARGREINLAAAAATRRGDL